MNRPAAITVAAVVAAALTASPALAKTKHKPKPKPKPITGTWSYTDTTPDPTVTAESDASKHCHGNLPAAPTDVNAHTISVTGPGTLTVVGHNALDWAMEVRNSKGIVLAGSDGSTPTDAEGTSLPLSKGTYTVVYCSAEGEPTITADYKYVYR